MLEETDWGFTSYEQLHDYQRDGQRMGDQRSSVQSRERPSSNRGKGNQEGLSERSRPADASQLLQNTKFADSSSASSITPTYRREKLQPTSLNESGR